MPAECKADDGDSLRDIEALVDRAFRYVRQPVPGFAADCTQDLEDAASALQALPAPDPARLIELRRKLRTIDTLARHAAAYFRGMEQADPNAVIGYTPAGVERAL